MVLDSKIRKAQLHFGIARAEDWQNIDVASLLALDGIGPVTIDHIRGYLAMRGLALRNDRTPEYWAKHLPQARVVHEMGCEDLLEDGETSDRAAICPFTVFIDPAEQQPFTFSGLTTDSDQGNRPLIVNTEWRALGRGENSLGDYSIDGYVGRVHVERKSLEDCQSTILGWKNGRRERFDVELANLDEIDRGHVVVECSFGQLIREAPDWGRKTPQENGKILFRSVLSWQHKYPRVQWHFCDDRRLAEITTFRVLERYWREQQEIRRQAVKQSVAATSVGVGPDVGDGQQAIAAAATISLF